MKENTECVFFFFACACVTRLHLFADEPVRPRSVGVGKQLGQARFSLLLHSIAVGHSEQVDPVAIQRVAQQLSMVIQTARFAASGGGTNGNQWEERLGRKKIRYKRDTDLR